ncbi:hypothetical protein FPCIR_10977 [Fusarium pseudocircinatum]|uniref:Uncharacterized protein n=1 Tax=Fusarium pseudocircinatum TaxID=56676 RepID=A0A8H5KVZ7_9HYPO|nr:hypothetical protein FPCIR_10977 [Fusarium pseudocircinatum]
MNNSIEAAVRRVTIEATPWSHFDGYGGNSLAVLTVLDFWGSPAYSTAFTVAVRRICYMPNLKSLTYEPPATRERALEIISQTLEVRRLHPNTSIIRELVLYGLEDTPLSTHVTDNLFRNIERLHIKVAYSDEQRERPQFARYLSGTLLPLVSDRLVELTLAGHLWGAIPVEFNGKSLSFPLLKSLTLDDYVVLRQDQFDWVLGQRSLSSLRLYNCRIATHCLVDESDFEDWSVNLNGWKKTFDTPIDMDQSNHGFMSTPYLESLQPGWYTNDLRWSNLFDRVRENLPELHNFTFERVGWASYFEGSPDVIGLDELFERYLTFYDGYWDTAWYKPVTENGVWTEIGWVKDDSVPGCAAGLDTRTEPADRQALEKLMEVTRKRREGK